MNQNNSDSEDDIDVFLEESLRIIEDRDRGLDISAKIQKLEVPWRCPHHIRQIYNDLQKLVKSDEHRNGSKRSTNRSKRNPVIKVECCRSFTEYYQGVKPTDFLYLGIIISLFSVVYFMVGGKYYTNTPIY